MSRKRKVSKSKARKQYGTDKVMRDKETGMFFGVVNVHQGRVTRPLRGQDAVTIEDAVQALNDGMYRGVG